MEGKLEADRTMTKGLSSIWSRKPIVLGRTTTKIVEAMALFQYDIVEKVLQDDLRSQPNRNV